MVSNLILVIEPHSKNQTSFLESNLIPGIIPHSWNQTSVLESNLIPSWIRPHSWEQTSFLESNLTPWIRPHSWNQNSFLGSSLTPGIKRHSLSQTSFLESNLIPWINLIHHDVRLTRARAAWDEPRRTAWWTRTLECGTSRTSTWARAASSPRGRRATPPTLLSPWPCEPAIRSWRSSELENSSEPETAKELKDKMRWVTEPAPETRDHWWA